MHTPYLALLVLNYAVVVSAGYQMSSELRNVIEELENNSDKMVGIRLGAEGTAMQSYDADGKAIYQIPINASLQSEYTNGFVASMNARPKAKEDELVPNDDKSPQDSCQAAKHPRNIFRAQACYSYAYMCIPGTTRGDEWCRYCFGCDKCLGLEDEHPLCVGYS